VSPVSLYFALYLDDAGNQGNHEMRIGPYCLYSAVSDPSLFSRVGFYRDDLAAMATMGVEVYPIFRISDVWKFRPSVLVGYFYSRSLGAAVVGRLIKARVVLTGGADQISPSLSSGLRLAVHRLVAFLCLCVAHKVVLSCAEDYQEFKRVAMGRRWLLAKLVKAPHVVRPSGDARSVSRQVAGEFRAFTICWLGSIENAKRKGLDRAIQLIAALRDIGVDATLDIAGTAGKGLAFIEELANYHKVSPFVRFCGAISDEEKDQRYLKGAVYLQLSRYEGFGVAAAEAFLSGMIVVHTNKGGLRDVISDNGIIIDVEELLAGGRERIAGFYNAFLSFEVDRHLLIEESRKYSVEARAKSLLE
jgi:glycosyltransferase involved in cell wall biosynthesis